MAAKPAGTPHGPLSSTSPYRDALRPVALEHAHHDVQLAICSACGSGRSLLWTRLAQVSPHSRQRDNPCHGRHGMVDLAALILAVLIANPMVPVRAIPK